MCCHLSPVGVNPQEVSSPSPLCLPLASDGPLERLSPALSLLLGLGGAGALIQSCLASGNPPRPTKHLPPSPGSHAALLTTLLSPSYLQEMRLFPICTLRSSGRAWMELYPLTVPSAPFVPCFSICSSSFQNPQNVTPCCPTRQQLTGHLAHADLISCTVPRGGCWHAWHLLTHQSEHSWKPPEAKPFSSVNSQCLARSRHPWCFLNE